MATNVFTSGGFSIKEVANRTWAQIRKDDVFGRAAQLAYYFFLALFPFLICVIASLSIFGFADKGRALVFHFFSGALPPSAYRIIDTTITDIIRASGPLKMSFGILGAVWSASAGMSALMDTLNAAYQVQETRPLWKQYAVSTALTVGIALLLIISVLFILAGNKIVEVLAPGKFITEAWKFAQWPLELALILFAFAATYYFAPDLKERKWHWLTPGALVGLLLWMGVSTGLRIYLHFSSGYDAIYGSLGAVIVLLLWFYLSGIAVLSGAEVNGVLERLAPPRDAAQSERQVPSAA